MITGIISILCYLQCFGTLSASVTAKNENGNFVSAADVWNAEKLEELFTRLNPNRKLRLEREKAKKEE